MNKIIDLYHGSDHIITKPEYGVGKLNNDYGPGFYCTVSPNLAKEWAVDDNRNGYANHYNLDTTSLKHLNLNNGEYHILNWLAILLENRIFDMVPSGIREISDNPANLHASQKSGRSITAD